MADSNRRLLTAAHTAAGIRQRFVDYFVARGHTHVPSSSLVPQDDPTLLFVNAGMNQFKDVFTGREQRPYSRAVTVQRCVRAGGKHNDLDNVGFTPRHQTLFEMLGNFSFGDYFKREAIEWAWKFLTEDLGLPSERLVVTIYDGQGEDAPPDEEAAELWAAYVPRGRIYRCSAKDNFWQMGDTGPCGPCSEIHIYKGDVAPATAAEPGTGPAYADSDFVELWNLVFMQYEKPGDGTMRPLPKPSIDTGSGLERVAAAVLGAGSNYETDLLSPMVEEAKRLAGDSVPSGVGEAPFRVIADHARATAFLVADGVFPDKGGRNYVLRRIMRRAIRHGADVGLAEPFMHEVCRKVIEVFGDVYPELHERAAVIEEVVRGEEESFRRTLDRGLRRLRKSIDKHESGRPSFDPAVAADLYNTYGFPIDLTAVILREHGLSLDEKAAEAELKAQQGEGGGRGSDLGAGEAVADVYFEVHGEVGDTEFLGYASEEARGVVTAIVVDGASVERAEAGQAVELVLDRTPFYAESGGQVGDTGLAFHTEPSAKGGATVKVEIEDTLKPRAGMHVHRGRVLHGEVRVGTTLTLQVDRARRQAIRRNHSATHLLHHALRAELGEHVVQKGSLVSPERLRFDFSHNRAITVEQRRALEQRVNAMVLSNTASVTKELSMLEAKAEGAIGLFGEKYGERVRVVRLADDSVELCGGTHVERAGDIGLFSIVGESSIAQGVRRIEAVTGEGALAYVQSLAEVTAEASAQLHAGSPQELPERIGRLQAELKQRDREIATLKQKLATGGGTATDEVTEVEGIKLLTRRLSGTDVKTLRSAADALRDRLGSGVVVLAAETDGKATLLVAITKDLQARVHAGKLVGELARHVDGRGGGRPDLAQAGGPKLTGLDEALGAAEPALRALLGAA
ncbi:alanine--tRNA ligase [Paraliomyxa miuraensis]|uniref:alanine--tRNA ligase n=1 Tax=Paraliomyxa miuraensis TaxID=376150 RepID=UPI002257AF85|nr:alanine--tRNA ligase [Paraliomyxa miuraensis]MCX4245415.1 alanine--tRNA ligase [Paraliomyxa miuraensis]